MLNWLLALLSAVLLTLTFPKANLSWLAPVALTPLLIALARESRLRRRFLLGWAAGSVYWFSVCYWIQFVMAIHGGLNQAEGWAVLLLFALAKGLHLALFGMLSGMLLRRWWAAPSVAALWVAIEVTHGPLGFAWLTLGNAGIDMGVPMRLSPYTGVYGLSFLFVLMSTVLALALMRRPRRELLWLLLVPLIALLPKLPAPEPGDETAILVQSNISETEQWTTESLDHMEQNQVTLSLRGVLADLRHRPSIVVWAEMPAPFYYDQDEKLRGYINDLTRTAHAYLLTGTVGHRPDGGLLNSAMLFAPTGRPLSRYDKVNLVPFGEFVPWPFGFANKISTEIGDFVPGKNVVVSPIAGHQLGTFICYEAAFPNFVRQFARDGAEVLFNISNDGWFGKSAARRQHLDLVRMRAAENRRWLLRATNDGITAAVDPAGRVRNALPPYTEAVSSTGFNYISQRTLYSRFGDWFPLLCAVLAITALLAERAM